MTLVSGIILAGGRATRMHGRDKGLVIWQDRPLIEHMLERIRPQVDDVIISCNRNHETYSRYAVCQGDEDDGFAGPLAGLAACLPLCRHQKVLVVACDMPLLPGDLAEKLLNAMAMADVAVAHDGEHLQPLAMLVDKAVLPSLLKTVAAGHATVKRWIQGQNHVEVLFDNPNLFVNINSMADLDTLTEPPAVIQSRS